MSQHIYIILCLSTATKGGIKTFIFKYVCVCVMYTSQVHSICINMLIHSLLDIFTQIICFVL